MAFILYASNRKVLSESFCMVSFAIFIWKEKFTKVFISIRFIVLICRSLLSQFPHVSDRRLRYAEHILSAM